ITYAGEYISWFDAWLVSQELANRAVVINAGLPSETVSGLSEAGHAGGQFPRPDLAERLKRVLTVTKPDLVFACYGINCGIYQPLNEQRFERYQQGITKLKDEVEAFGAQLILITPPCFDDQRAQKNYSYNKVLNEYSKWLVKQENDDWMIIDLHGPMSHELSERRKSNPNFTFQPDAVHPNAEGHRFIAEQLIDWFGGPLNDKGDKQIRKLVDQRLKLRRDAYLAAAGHKRPGIRSGLPVKQAEQEAEKLTQRMNQDSVNTSNPRE
ncbi:MAG: GDSL-type esterase/lipase family protein, partial [Pirellulaceae bacterium]|nr:GDSL-type esterase/lipase family protein [Pirellulaceae bacterium]